MVAPADTSPEYSHHGNKHPYHLVDPSPWPFMGAMSALVMMVGAVLYMHEIRGGAPVLIIGVLAVLLTMFLWFRDVIREATFDGYHNPIVQISMRYGMALFIASEVMFFVAWFWAYFNASLFPNAAIDGTWPPPGVQILRMLPRGIGISPDADGSFRSSAVPGSLMNTPGAPVPPPLPLSPPLPLPPPGAPVPPPLPLSPPLPGPA